jgi:aspartate kinase
MGGCRLRTPVVMKLGGSILKDDESYRQVARFLVRRLHRCAGEHFLVVVSAQNGQTNELEELARGITSTPEPRALDLLWSTGEIRSVAVLTLHLEDMGVDAVGLNIHEMGLRIGQGWDARPSVRVVGTEIQRAIDEHAVVVVPGFFGTKEGGAVVSLGRGGSDLSAVLLAKELDTGRCELIKDVAGYYTRDPDRNPDAEYLPWISYETAVQMAESGCELVQALALEEAREGKLQLLVRGLGDAPAGTVVSSLRDRP